MIRILLPTIVISALLQALTVVGDPVPQSSWSFAARAFASSVIVVLSTWLIVGAVGRHRPTFRLLVAVAAAVVVGVAAGIVNPILPVLVALVALPVLTSIAVDPTQSVLRAVACSPLRSVLGVVLVAIVFFAAWLAALLLGLFVTGPVAAALTWFVFGLGTAILAAYWVSLHRRAGRSPAFEGPGGTELSDVA